jgi:hypothetical protein
LRTSRGDLRGLSHRQTHSVGCSAGKWPPVYYDGKVLSTWHDSGGAVIHSSQRIAGGQSGGALFDTQTGLVIGITNWGSGRTTESLFSETWLNALKAALR